ncbi:unnamed protein product [Triticum turgidum subsp. durum]|uniref:Uncharacterized protein n=1 Tax=Triticum turgidum subsp. durum TaxID=4567 RepID=A0A9R0TGN5_TRITD|nr:unnamed protein product [Triticum turgidum subsp. durum]
MRSTFFWKGEGRSSISTVAVLPCLPSRPAASLLRPQVPSRATLVVCLGAKPKVPLPIASPSPLGDDPAKWDPAECDALLRGGEQVASVLQEMLTLMEDMEMDGAFAPVAVELVAQGVIGNRVDEMESGFLMALDYMIQLAQKDGDDERNSLLEIVKQTVLDHLTKKCPPHSMETRPTIPDRKLLARLVIVREEARNMMGGGLLDERNDRGLNTLPQAEVNFLSKLVALKPGKAVEKMISDVMHGKEEGADNTESTNAGPNSDLEPSTGTSGRENATGRKPQPVRPGMFLETVSKVLGGIYAKNTSGITAQHLEWVHQTTLKVLQEMAF